MAALISAVLVDAAYIHASEMIQRYMELAYPILIGLGIIADTSTPGMFDKEGDA